MNSQTSDETLDRGRVQRIFALMQANYGSRWVDQTGTGNALKLAAEVWAKKLAGLHDNQIAYGLENLPEDFPPTPAKFKNICMQLGGGALHNTAAYKLLPKALPAPRNKDKAKQAIAEMRQALGAS